MIFNQIVVPRFQFTKAIVKKIMVLLILYSLTSGCGTILRTGLERDTDLRYAATRADIALLKEYWSPSGNGSWNPVRGMWFMTPITVLDVPFAVVYDTILLPRDSKNFSKNSAAEVFWRNILDSPSALPTVAQSTPYCTPYASTIINHELHYDYSGRISAETIDLLTQLAIDRNLIKCGISLHGIAAHKNLRLDTWMSIYENSKNEAPNYDLLKILARNPATPPEMFAVLSKHSNYYVIEELAMNPSTPPEVLLALENDAKDCIEREKKRHLRADGTSIIHKRLSTGYREIERKIY